MSARYLCIHGHFYQPAREDPFSGEVPAEVEAAPYHDFNEKITAECYRPNAAEGNFGRVSFDLGPTLAAWLERRAPEVLGQVQAAERQYRARHDASNALAQPYNHTILPLASEHERRVQIAWGVADYTLRFGHAPTGMWLPETAVDLPTLRALADAGLHYTILAPWQAAEPVDPSEPYRVDLQDGREFTVFFYHAALSGSVSFNADVTVNADAFSMAALPGYLNGEKLRSGAPQLLLLATDGELYGHHQPLRDKFLAHLLTVSAPEHGFKVTSLEAYLRRYPPRRTVAIKARTSWSCHHGVSRWREGCACTEGPSAWKRPLRLAFDRLAGQIDALFERAVGHHLPDPWQALEAYIAVRLGRQDFPTFVQRFAPALSGSTLVELARWFAAEYYRQLMLTSCGFFFEDLDRIEPRNNIADAARALSLLPPLPGRALEAEFLDQLAAARSSRSACSGADLYAQALAVAGLRREQPPAGHGCGSGFPAALQVQGGDGGAGHAGGAQAAAIADRS